MVFMKMGREHLMEAWKKLVPRLLFLECSSQMNRILIEIRFPLLANQLKFLLFSPIFIEVLLSNVGMKSGRGPGPLTRTVPDFWGPWTERIENWPRKLSVTYWFQAWNSQNESFGKDFFEVSSLASWSTYTEIGIQNFRIFLKFFCLPEFLKVNEYHHDLVRCARMVKTSKFQLKELVLRHLVPNFSSSGYTYLISIFLDIHRWLVTGSLTRMSDFSRIYNEKFYVKYHKNRAKIRCSMLVIIV